jgi:hypothetical protein
MHDAGEPLRVIVIIGLSLPAARSSDWPAAGPPAAANETSRHPNLVIEVSRIIRLFTHRPSQVPNRVVLMTTT